MIISFKKKSSEVRKKSKWKVEKIAKVRVPTTLPIVLFFFCWNMGVFFNFKSFHHL